MTTNPITVLACDALADDVKSGLAKKQPLGTGNLGSSSQPHYIYLVKIQTSVKEDPNQRYKPTGGTHFFQIRPNEKYEDPSRENGKDWNWHLLSCPHPIPCPILEE
jgi:hypothetical protein